MYRTLIEKNGRGEEISVSTQGSGNPRNPDGAPFIIETNAGSKTMRLYLTYKEIKTLAQGLQTALHEADREYEDEQEDACSVSELTTNFLKGYMGW